MPHFEIFEVGVNVPDVNTGHEHFLGEECCVGGGGRGLDSSPF